MKWFEHDANASEDVKILLLEEKFGNNGYAFFFKCLEIIAKEGIKGSISFEKFPKRMLAKKTNVSDEVADKILTEMGRLKLCDPKLLKNNTLSFPNFKKRADTYSKRMQSKLERSLSIIRSKDKESSPTIQYNTTHNKTKPNITKQYITDVVEKFVSIRGFSRESLFNDDWVRFQTAAKNLLIKADCDVETCFLAIEWVSEQGYPWTLETVVKKYPEFLVEGKTKEIRKLEESVN